LGQAIANLQIAKNIGSANPKCAIDTHADCGRSTNVTNFHKCNKFCKSTNLRIFRG